MTDEEYTAMYSCVHYGKNTELVKEMLRRAQESGATTLKVIIAPWDELCKRDEALKICREALEKINEDGRYDDPLGIGAISKSTRLSRNALAAAAKILCDSK